MPNPETASPTSSAPSAEPGTTLDRLPLGRSAVVRAVGGHGAQRRRLLDLGLLPGARVTAEFRSPLRDPTAYRVRGALLALRREQARQIDVTPLETATEDPA